MNWKFWEKKNNLKGKGRNYLRYLHLLAIVVLFGIGGAVAYLGNNTQNPLLILVGFAALSGSFILFLQWRNMGAARILGESGKDGGPLPNSLVIYPSRIVFDYFLHAPGQPQKCYNDGKFYYVLRGEEASYLEELTLPDEDEKERYYDPQEFANPVTMPSNKKYFTWSASLLQTVSLGIMAIVIAGEIIGLIVLGG